MLTTVHAWLKNVSDVTFHSKNLWHGLVSWLQSDKFFYLQAVSSYPIKRFKLHLTIHS